MLGILSPSILSVMPRLLRLDPAGLCFHVVNRGNGRATVFHKAEDCAARLRILAPGCEGIVRPVGAV